MKGRKVERRGGEGRWSKLRAAHHVGNLQHSFQKVNFNFFAMLHDNRYCRTNYFKSFRLSTLLFN